MEPQHDKVVDGNSVISFSSGAKFPFFKLSNFYGTPVRYLGTDFPCSEHAYQSQLFPDAIQLFQKGGILSALSVEAFLYLGLKQKEGKKNTSTGPGKTWLVSSQRCMLQDKESTKEKWTNKSAKLRF